MKKKGFACGVFDLFHAGHVLMLKECKENCDFLIVGLNEALNFSAHINPGKKKPIYSFKERKLILESCKYIDLVIGYNSESDLINLMKEHQIDIRFLGEDYRGKPITGREICPNVYYIDRSHGLSTSKYRNEIQGKYID